MKPAKKEYAVYKGDEFVDIGKRKELCAKLGIKESTFIWYSTPTYVNKRYKNGILIVKLEDEEEERDE